MSLRPRNSSLKSSLKSLRKPKRQSLKPVTLLQKNRQQSSPKKRSLMQSSLLKKSRQKRIQKRLNPPLVTRLLRLTAFPKRTQMSGEISNGL